MSCLTNIRHSIHFCLKIYANHWSTLMLASWLGAFDIFLSGPVDGKYVRYSIWIKEVWESYQLREMSCEPSHWNILLIMIIKLSAQEMSCGPSHWNILIMLIKLSAQVNELWASGSKNLMLCHVNYQTFCTICLICQPGKLRAHWLHCSEIDV